MARRVTWLAVAGCLLVVGACNSQVVELDPNLGGDTTRGDVSRNSFSLPAPGLTNEERRLFEVGDSFFTQNWVSAPASTEARDGLGPVFNAQACASCHLLDGRGLPPDPAGEETRLGLLVRLSVPGADPVTGAPLPDPVYGDQLQDRSVLGVPAEGTLNLTYEYIVGTDGDGISGRANMVWDARAGTHTLGRFGWKANVATAEQQAAGAFHGDIGITSALHPEENCTTVQRACAAAPNGGTPEITDSRLAFVVLYLRTLAVPAMRGHDTAPVRAGARLFADFGCAACHTPTHKTATADLSSLSNQTIHPYTDLLLHDMGPGLADNRQDFAATGSEWRTSPLWGLGLVDDVQGYRFLLHDGRARTFEEAILWHGGEAEASREAFRMADAEDRAALVAFLEAL